MASAFLFSHPQVGEIGVGDAYYVDRAYTFRTLPPFLHSLNGIKTSPPPPTGR